MYTIQRNVDDMRAALDAAAEVARFCQANAHSIDHYNGFPNEEFARLGTAGLLAAPLARACSGLGMGGEQGGSLPLLRLLRQIGWGNLVVGRLYEGHVNALLLIQTFGTPDQIERYAADARDAHQVFGVWNTQPADGVRLVPLGGGRVRLEGAKFFASGAGHIARPLITGALPDGGWQMCVVPMDRLAAEIDPSGWRPLGMRASASYRVDFTGIELDQTDLIGAPGDYYREPYFGGGAIRFAAVHLGGAAALFDAARTFLRDTGRTDDPYQTMRAGDMAVLVESGDLWLRGAAEMAERSAFVLPQSEADDPTHLTTYAALMRTAIARICTDVMRLTEQTIGARGLLQPYSFERIIRDLTMYLRQPAPDAVLANAGRYVLGSAAPSSEMWQR